MITNKQKKIVLFGDSVFAEVAYEYFTHDSDYEVVAFTVHQVYLQKNTLFGLPVVPFEQLVDLYPPQDYSLFIALVYNQLNRIRKRVYEEAKQKGYKLANYVSSRAAVWHNVSIGDNVFIFENNTVQPFVTIGSNVILWSGNHIGHHSILHNHIFMASQVVVAGFCEVGEGCFVGVNATFANNIKIGEDCLIGAGALVVKNVPDRTIVKGMPSSW
ncbi:MAG: acetyltransferase, partial [Thermoflexibacteraceae bacterium]